MYNIIYCSDLHGNEKLYEKLFEKAKDRKIEAVVVGGDICPNARGSLKIGIKTQKEFLSGYLLSKIKNSNKETFIMMGNDDFRVNMGVLEEAARKGHIKLLHNRVNTIGKYYIIGYSFVPPMPFLLKDWEKLDDEHSQQITNPELDIRTENKAEGTIKEDFRKIKEMSNPLKTIYVTHAPPFGTRLDITTRGDHVGSKSIRDFINKEQPPLTLHGHLHEGPETGSWKDIIKRTTCINPGSAYLSSRLNMVVIDLDDMNKIDYMVI